MSCQRGLSCTACDLLRWFLPPRAVAASRLWLPYALSLPLVAPLTQAQWKERTTSSHFILRMAVCRPLEDLCNRATEHPWTGTTCLCLM